jgi:probable selenium-dependent hydroxylase accessory protein YqeC
VTFAPPPALALDDAFALRDHSYIFLIGGGGKTTLMFTLAHHLAQAGRTVVTTTSTRIRHPCQTEAGCVIVEDNRMRLVSRLRYVLPYARHVAIGRVLDEADQKLSGFTIDELDYLWLAKVADHLIIEADGAAGRSLKAHGDQEPVVSPQADLVIAVIGSDCVGCALIDAHVHRAERFSLLVNRAMGAPVDVEAIQAIFFHPLGYLKRVPSRANVVVLISKAGVGSQRANAERLAVALDAADHDRRIMRIVIGELTGPSPFLESVA